MVLLLENKGLSVSSPTTEYTVSEKILLAAYNLDKEGKTPFSAEDLIVTSWGLFPTTFGLKGYASQFPDSNKVLTSIMGERGLAKRGWLAKMGQKLYSITKEGKRVAARLSQESIEPTPAATVPAESEPAQEKYVTVSKEKEKFLQMIFSSTAVRKFEEGQKNDLAFADACRFWDITQNLKGDAVDERLAFVEDMLNQLEQDLGQEDARLSNGRMVTGPDIRVLRNIHYYMEDRFERVLNLLRSRKK